MSNWGSHIFWSGLEAENIISSIIAGAQKPIALVIGEGFDPRMLDCLKILVLSSNLHLKVYLLQIGRSEGLDQTSLVDRAKSNVAELEVLLTGKGTLEVINTQFENEDRNSTAPSASDKSVEFARALELDGLGTVIIDISALPQGLYFPLLEILIGQRREEFKASQTSLYVFVSENVELDARISGQELQEDAYMVPPFRSALSVSEDNRPIVWFPVLGEGESEQISRVEKLLPARVEREVCPILPMPSTNPRRADQLIREYERTLQDGWAIDSRSFIYSDERNPFHLYMQLIRAASRYRDALVELGGCRAVVSCHSSKLLSLGALLAASELNEVQSDDFDIGLANVDATAYKLSESADMQPSNSTFFLIPLLGEVYED